MNVFDAYYNSQIAKAYANLNLNGTFLNVAGTIVDTRGYEAAEFVFTAVSVSGLVTIDLYESDDSDMVGENLVGVDELLGNPFLDDSNLITRFGYIGKKQYIRAKTSQTSTDVVNLTGSCFLMNPLHQPQPEQPI